MSSENVNFNTYIHNPSFPSRTPLITDTTNTDTSINDTPLTDTPIKEAPVALGTTPEKPYKLIDEHSDKNIIEP